MRLILLFVILFCSSHSIASPIKALVIGSNSQLVDFLKKQQYEVDVLSLVDGGSEGDMHLPKWDGPELTPYNSNLASAFRIYRFLKDKNYRVIFFPEHNGYGYYLTEAKKQGYGFESTTLIGLVTEPVEWLWDISDIIVPKMQSYIAAEMEQKSIEQADFVIVPSNFAYQLLTKKGWKFPNNTKILPPLYKANEPTTQESQIAHDIKEITFIGPCNFRMGCDLFAQTINKARAIDLKTMDGITITILNKGSEEDVEKLVRGLSNINYVDDKNYIEYIKDPSRMNLFTSREELGSHNEYVALHEHARFIGMRDGFLEEITKNEDILASHLNTSELAKKLIETLKRPVTPIATKSLHEANQEWRDFFNQSSHLFTTSPVIKKFDDPFVSVAITHFNRPEQLMEALQEFDKQTYKEFEVIVMDDGSTPEVLEKLRRDVEPFMHERGWRIFYQENGFISNARNNLVEHTKGPLILLFEDDDLPFTDTVERFVRIWQMTGADIVNTNMAFAGRDKREVSSLVLVLGSYVPSMNGKNQMGYSAISLMPKTIFQKLSGYLDLYGFTHSDMEFYIRAALNGAKIVTAIEPTYIFNAAGEDHWSKYGANHHPHHTRQVFKSYQEVMPKEFRNIPFWIFSFEESSFNKTKALVYDMPLWQIIALRLAKCYDDIMERITDQL